MIDIIGLSKRFSDKKLFEDVNLKLLSGHTYGVIGANGAGKSTMLKIIYGAEDATNGQIIIEKGRRMSVLDQDQNKYDDQTVTDVVVMGNQVLYKLQEEKNAIYTNPDSSDSDFEKAAELEEKFGALGGWNSENDAQILLGGIGIDADKWYLPLSELKAVEKVKVLLAKALFGNPDILILDEPTNGLDLKAVAWLEKFLVEYENLVIVVSHDSDFLDEVCTNIIDVDFGGANMTPGNYTFWKQASLLAQELKQRSNLKAEAQVKKLQEFVTKFSANASKSSQATSRKKALDKIQINEIKPSSRKYPYIQWDISREPGKDILAVKDLTHVGEDGETYFENLSFTLHGTEKVALLGSNNLAKTALFDILTGKLKPTRGEVKWGITIKYDFLPDDNASYFQEEISIVDWLSQWPLLNELDENKENDDQKIRSFLGRMLFSGDSALKKSNVTSGGEKARLMFSKMMLTESNFLLLNQPLEHLDSESIDSVIEGVKNYKSGVIFATYNRAMIRSASTAILNLDETNPFLHRLTIEEYEKKIGIK